MGSDGALVLTVRNLSCRYGARWPFRDVSFELRSGEVLGILGRVGVGKTRILRMVRGLEEPAGGTIQFAPEIERRRMSYVFQSDQLIPWLTARENLAFCAHGADVAPIASEFGFTRWLDLKPAQLSGGLRQKVNLARGFLGHPQIVLMDEPFSALDPVEKADLMKLFIKKSKTALFVTHDIREALLVCDRIAFLSASEGKISRVFENPYRGDTDSRALFARPDYAELYWSLHECYERDGGQLAQG